MKKVLVICGTGIATSTVIMNKLKEFFAEKQMQVQLDQSKVSDILSVGNDYDLIVSTTIVPPTIKTKVVNAIPLLTGVGKEKVFNDILEALK
ncbi:PTS sugar transporter subunit IIB [Caldibacillus debilis]|uniref:PTS system IIB component, Gat family n=2 Tax=Caldibacillus debilis TaxID=301148 RepID=A0A420VGU5_9BACI|nr:PTS sugar transporter subunit IIB [Caldibacillus debilis]RKO62912.1 PTS system IIB component, Gat family [Caldibacillus debilis GB1]